jgi:hypothetical protein
MSHKSMSLHGQLQGYLYLFYLFMLDKLERTINQLHSHRYENLKSSRTQFHTNFNEVFLRLQNVQF